MTLFLGHSTAFRILRSLDRASLLNASQAVPRSQGIPTLAKKNTLHPALAGKPLPFDVIVPDEKNKKPIEKAPQPHLEIAGAGGVLSHAGKGALSCGARAVLHPDGQRMQRARAGENRL